MQSFYSFSLFCILFFVFFSAKGTDKRSCYILLGEKNILEAELRSSLDKLTRFQEEILSRSNILFPGYSIKADQFFLDKAEEISDSKRKKVYKSLLAKIGLKPQDFQTGARSSWATERVQSALLALAQAKGYAQFDPLNIREVSELVGINPDTFSILEDLGTLDGAKNNQKREEFKKNILMRSLELFPGYTAKIKTFFEEKAKSIPNEKKRKVYLDALKAIGIHEKDIFVGQRNGRIGAMEAVYRALNALAVAKGHEPFNANNIEDVANLLGVKLGTTDILLGLGSLKGEANRLRLNSFKDNVLSKHMGLFQGSSGRIKTFFRNQAESIPNEKLKKEYQELLKLIDLKENDLLDRNREGNTNPTERVYRALNALAIGKGYEEFNPLNLEEVAELLGVGGKRFSILKELGNLSDEENKQKLLDFKNNILSRTQELFPRFSKKTKTFFEVQTKSISNEELRKEYQESLKIINLREDDILDRSDERTIRPAERIYQALRALAIARGKPELDVTNFKAVKELLALGTL